MDSTKAVTETSEEETSMAAIGMSSKEEVDVCWAVERDEEREENDVFEPTSYHPLLNPVVLPRLFDYVSGGKGLKECRLVSKQWNLCSLPITRRRLLVRIWDHPTHNRVQDFTSLMSSNKMGTPFGRYNISGPHLSEVLGNFEGTVLESSIQYLTLSFHGKESWAVVQRMAAGPGGMRLRKLDLVVSEFHHVHWMDVVTLFRHSLRSLAVRLGEGRRTTDSPPIIFPIMPKLTWLRLELACFQGRNAPCLHRNLSCEDLGLTFPALQELKLSICNQEIRFDEFIRGWGGGKGRQSSAVKTLTLQTPVHPPFKLQSWILPILFPHLTRLTCTLRMEDGVQVVRSIWTQMGQLEGLHIQGSLPYSENLDSLVTGIPVRELDTALAYNIQNYHIQEGADDLVRRTTLLRQVMDPAIPKIRRDSALKQMMEKYNKLPSIRNLTSNLSACRGRTSYLLG